MYLRYTHIITAPTRSHGAGSAFLPLVFSAFRALALDTISWIFFSLAILTSKSGVAPTHSLAKPTMPSALLEKPSTNDFGEKKRAFSFFCFASDTGRMVTPNTSPDGTDGIFVWHACTHLPPTLTAQVPHSPFLHLYLMNTSAWVATSLNGWPTRAIVALFSGWKTTGILPSSSWPLGIVYGFLPGRVEEAIAGAPAPAGVLADPSFFLLLKRSKGLPGWFSPSKSISGRMFSRLSSIFSAFVMTGSSLIASLAIADIGSGCSALLPRPNQPNPLLRCVPPPRVSGFAIAAVAAFCASSSSFCSFSLSASGVLSYARRCCASFSLRSSLDRLGSAPRTELRIRALSSMPLRIPVAAPTTFSVGHGDLGW
mmetsp:Transcript_31128/g.54706  ORF Transcript_31128/g.54706 Transcript_31128/m.54706 type:complete len:369 (+) Transcript_31128:195-1301(+)